MKLDPTTGHFLRTPVGTKTAKMLNVERDLGRTLEEDYREYYTQKHYGQTRMASRWGITKNLLFAKPAPGRRNWVQMLNLPVRKNESDERNPNQSPAKGRECEACGIKLTSFDLAHWISRKDGGKSVFYNLLSLCPNCHRLLDRADQLTTETCRESLLIRSIRRLLNDEAATKEERHRLYHIVEQIVTRQITHREFT
jgi:HNH endonuclease